MINLFAIPIGAFVVLVALAALTYNFIVYPIRTSSFRRKCTVNDRCRFYLGENKLSGYIRRRMGERVEVEYVDVDGRYGFRSMHTKQLYPEW